jgi:beta-glucosidase
VTASVVLRNAGRRRGEETVQLYIRDLAATEGARPVRELKGFQRVALKPGEKRNVRFVITEQELGYYDADGQWLVEHGDFDVWIAPNAAAGKPARLTLR